MRLAIKAAQPHQYDVAPILDAVSSNASTTSAIEPLLEVLHSINLNLKRIADHFNPDDDKPVGTPYVAHRLGQTTTWVAEMARKGILPKACIVAGTGTGKPWKFHRSQIDQWIEDR